MTTVTEITNFTAQCICTLFNMRIVRYNKGNLHSTIFIENLGLISIYLEVDRWVIMYNCDGCIFACDFCNDMVIYCFHAKIEGNALCILQNLIYNLIGYVKYWKLLPNTRT